MMTKRLSPVKIIKSLKTRERDGQEIRNLVKAHSPDVDARGLRNHGQL